MAAHSHAASIHTIDFAFKFESIQARIQINILPKGDKRASNAYLGIHLFSFLSLIILYLLSKRFGDKRHPFASGARVNHAESRATIEKNAEGVSSSDARDLLMG